MSKQTPPPAPLQPEPGSPIKTAQHETAQDVGNVRPRLAEAAAPATDAVLAKWKKHIGSARIVWSRLSDAELRSKPKASRETGRPGRAAIRYQPRSRRLAGQEFPAAVQAADRVGTEPPPAATPSRGVAEHPAIALRITREAESPLWCCRSCRFCPCRRYGRLRPDRRSHPARRRQPVFPWLPVSPFAPCWPVYPVLPLLP